MRKIYRDTNLKLVFGITLMVVMSVSSIIPALPTMLRFFDLTPRTIGLVITVFTLPGVFLSPLFGVLADRVGRKKILVPSLIVFGTAGTLCTLATSWPWLLFLRFVQGIGAASLGVLNMTIIGDLYSGPQRTAAMGYNAGVLSIGTALFPALGGILATLGWNYPFLLPASALPLALLVLRHLDIPEPTDHQPLLLYLRGAIGKMLNRQVLGLFLATLAIFILLYGPFVTYLPILLDTSFKATPAGIGATVSIASLATALVASRLGSIARRVPERALIPSAFLLYATAFALIPLASNLWVMLGPVLVFGMGQALGIPNVVSLLNGLVDMRSRAAMMAVNGTLLRLGQTIGPLSMAWVFGLGGLDLVFATASILALCLGLAIPLFLRPPGRQSH